MTNGTDQPECPDRGARPGPGGREVLSESNRSENYRLLRISLREGSVVVRGLQVTSARDQELVVGGVLPEPPTSSPIGQRVPRPSARARVVNCGGVKLKVPSKAEAPG